MGIWAQGNEPPSLQLPVVAGLGSEWGKVGPHCVEQGPGTSHWPHGLTWSCGDSHAERAWGEVSSAPPPPVQPHSAPCGALGGSGPCLLPCPPGSPECQSTAKTQGTAQPHSHGHGHPIHPEAPPPAPLAHRTIPPAGQVGRNGPEDQHQLSFGSPEAAALPQNGEQYAVSSWAREALAIRAVHSCPRAAPSTPLKCTGGVCQQSCLGGLPLHLPTQDPPRCQHLPLCALQQGRAVGQRSCWAEPHPSHSPICRLCPFTHERSRNVKPRQMSQLTIPPRVPFLDPCSAERDKPVSRGARLG